MELQDVKTHRSPLQRCLKGLASLHSFLVEAWVILSPGQRASGRLSPLPCALSSHPSLPSLCAGLWGEGQRAVPCLPPGLATGQPHGHREPQASGFTCVWGAGDGSGRRRWSWPRGPRRSPESGLSRGNLQLGQWGSEPFRSSVNWGRPEEKAAFSGTHFGEDGKKKNEGQRESEGPKATWSGESRWTQLRLVIG